jgi:hypothetical protein
MTYLIMAHVENCHPINDSLVSNDVLTHVNFYSLRCTNSYHFIYYVWFLLFTKNRWVTMQKIQNLENFEKT